ncbi:MAG TPA: 1,4-alpha-glucan branching enzyme, partial [Parachlamydiaceae bacterium]|nr:1,4-alpha-glucan branching enzyme [Parachlamydiaceae bacterium]
MKKVIITGDSFDPHVFLGLHTDKKGQVIRLFRPGAKSLHLEVLGKIEEATLIDDAGLFEYRIQGDKINRLDYRIYH